MNWFNALTNISQFNELQLLPVLWVIPAKPPCENEHMTWSVRNVDGHSRAPEICFETLTSVASSTPHRGVGTVLNLEVCDYF